MDRPARLAWIALAASLFVLASYGVVIEWLEHSDPRTAPRFDSGNADALEANVQREARGGDAGGAIADPIGSVRSVLRAQPLASEPMTVLALDIARRKGAANAMPLANEALQRNPRSAALRLWMADAAVRRGDFTSAVNHLDRLIVFRPQQSEPYIQMLAALAADQRSHTPILALTGTMPVWRDPLLNALNTGGGAPSLIYAISSQAGAAAASREAQNQTGFINALLARGDYERAYLAWVNFLPENAVSQAGLVFDPGFRGLPGPAPFNWTFYSRPDGSAERVSPAGVRLDHFGGAEALLLEQSLLLPPGRYQLAVNAALAGEGGSPRFQWRLTCVVGNRNAVKLDVAALTENARRFVAPFVISGDDCRHQRLTAVGLPNEFPAAGAAIVTNANISESGQ